MEKIRFIAHEGQQILLHELAGCGAADYLDSLKLATDIMRSQPESSVLVLVDVTNMQFGAEIAQATKEYVELSKSRIRAVAVIGISGFYESMLMFAAKAAQKKIEVFRDIERAKSWLIAEAN
jgi:hypothetical protein